MRITISGYGKMGREIEKTALERNHQISAIIDTEEDWSKFQTEINNSDVVIDFSQPDVVVQNILRCFESGIPIVSGTTGWDDKKGKIHKLCMKQGQTLFTASNFSIGVNIFFEVNRKLAELMGQQGNYAVGMKEIHHVHKLDKPSGTAIHLAEQIISNNPKLKGWTIQKNEADDKLFIESLRAGEVPGTHVVKYTSEVDRISIMHEAKSRKGFALGAVLAAEWVIGKKGMFGMKDMLGL
ncbi:MAG: 4-hydroxy-tetrahydrodipicolinate reductase [Chlorobi bacterium]|nr:4-hydroxy-tetrahydrodipicolinate reductase [Chlorobiota bacterium]